MQFLVQKEIKKGEIFILDENETFHLKKVLRIGRGEIIKVFDGKRKWECRIVDFRDKKAFLEVLKEISENEKPLINLYFPFIERKLFEEIIRRGVEIGVYGFHPVITDFTQRNFIFDIKTKKERLDRIIKSSIKQSEISFVPFIFDPLNIDELPFKTEKFILMTPYPLNGKIHRFSDIVDLIKKENKINLLVGPEGGFSEREKNIFNSFADSIIPVKISYNILRVETACIVSCGAILSLKV
jgi:16S rRNA (uracil1498-N3)-methyltransferase